MHPKATLRGTVLIVEDNEDIREALRDLLEDETYAVLEASDGLAGLALVRASQVALVVLVDYMMPRMDGFALMREAADDPLLLAHHAFILLTANDDRLPLAFVALLQALRTPIIGKPFELQDLLDAVTMAQQGLPPPSTAADDPREPREPDDGGDAEDARDSPIQAAK